MRLPRLRIWILMLVVALAALGSAAWILTKRSREYSERAAEHELQAVTFTQDAENARLLVENSLERTKAVKETLNNYKDILVGLKNLPAASDGAEAAIAAHSAAEEGFKRQLATNESNTRHWEAAYERAVISIREEHMRVKRWRRAARCPWLGPPRVKPDK
jgi:hypothetical protein